MIRRNLKQIQKMCNGFGLKEEFEAIEIKGVSTDTRTISPGQLFIPLIGENFNGHRFLKDAIQKGPRLPYGIRMSPLKIWTFH